MDNNYNFYNELEKVFKSQEEMALFMPDNETALEDFKKFLNVHGFKEISSKGDHSKKNHRNRRYMYKGLKDKVIFYSALSTTRIIMGYTKKYDSHQMVIAFVK